ncbi:tetratricopeptide repeat protein [Prevotella sp. oral taxon 299]|uniref:tetratricopeptide repeat protein n=1 Tax=Prevotella sp. oral taxon 299 TaxID=652716 RepID=UPI0001C4075B|nr:tetratricopeptide repeat protein [Prevotella sp. oral taxon 299]
MRYRIIITFLVLLFVSTIQAQNERKDIRKGNKAFRQQNYVQAEVDYRKATAKNGRNPQAIYNLGCAFMAQQKDSSAVVQFENASKIETNPKRRAMAFHNIGVICQKKQLFSEAIEAYKESLRNNPSDNETRYNLELCKRQLKNQNNNNNDKNQQNKNNKDKDNKNKEQQKKDQKDDKDKQQNNQQQQPKEQMSKDNAEQLLNAAMQKEKETQDRLKKAMRQSSTRKLERNW